MKINQKLIMLASAATLALSAVSLPTYAEELPDPLYTVNNGNEVDAYTYQGFKLYRQNCATCHAKYGQGLVGPNLAVSLETLTKDEFFDVVENGRVNTQMAPWKGSVKVMAGRGNLYAYLKARSDGEIGEVKPKKAK